MEELYKNVENGEMAKITREKLALYGESPLHWAAKHNDSELIKTMVGRGYSPNTCNFRGTSPLYYAALADSLEACQELLRVGADPREKSGFSGKYPDQATGSDQIKKILEEDRVKLQTAIDEDVTMHTLYRVRRWGEDCISYFAQQGTPAEKNWPVGYKIRKDLQDLDIEKMAIKLRPEWEVFYRHLESWHKGTFEKNKVCAFCGSDQGQKFRCGKCKRVYFCGRECQALANLSHKLTSCK